MIHPASARPRPHIAVTEILVIEEERDGAGGLAEVLRGDGHRVIRFANSLVALAHLHARLYDGLALPDLVVTDMEMRGVSGLVIVSSLRAAGWKKPAVVLTDRASPELQRQADDLRNVAVYQRPTDVDALRAHVFRSTEAS